MSIDMAQFHQVFFEESFEGLEIMENGLMELEPGTPDSEVINCVFRAAHSIKGGSGTFGFKAIADYTHVMETLLDEIRDGAREVTVENSDILLKSVDCLREMMEATQAEADLDVERVKEYQKMLEKELANDSGNLISANVVAPTVTSELHSGHSTGWEIFFKPNGNVLQTGNDPLPLLRELGELGSIKIESDLTGLPDFQVYDCENSYLSWSIKLETDASLEDINELFAWVKDDCELRIEAMSSEGEDISVASPIEAAEAIVESGLPVPSRRVDDQNAKVGGERRDPTEKLDRRKQQRRGNQSNAAAATSIRVDTVKIDSLINMVGELVITQSMLGLLGELIEENRTITPQEIEKMRDGLTQLERNTRELQENVMQVRMMPISFTFSRFPRLIRDLSGKLGKKIELKMTGENTEVDKNIIEKIGDPLVHLVRNSLDHGIEMPEDRLAAGKDQTGTINLNAYHGGGNIVIEIIDDGKGLNKDVLFEKGVDKGLISADDVLSDKQVFDLIFMAGFSTAEEVTDVSGRGVGMDVVRRNIMELGGNVEIDSTLGVGTKMTIRLPLTLAILDGQTITVGGENYIIPITSIVESLIAKSDMINTVSGQGQIFKLREEYIPIIRLHQIFGLEDRSVSSNGGLLVVVESEGFHFGLLIDELLGQQQVVIKSLESNYKRTEGFSGATILGDGTVALILDMPGIMRLNKSLQRNEASRAA